LKIRNRSNANSPPLPKNISPVARAIMPK
jgi:hypothetical protein